MSEKESKLINAYESLKFTKMIRDKHVINKWKHRIKVLENKNKKNK